MCLSLVHACPVLLDGYKFHSLCNLVSAGYFTGSFIYSPAAVRLIFTSVVAELNPVLQVQLGLVYEEQKL